METETENQKSRDRLYTFLSVAVILTAWAVLRMPVMANVVVAGVCTVLAWWCIWRRHMSWLKPAAFMVTGWLVVALMVAIVMMPRPGREIRVPQEQSSIVYPEGG